MRKTALLVLFVFLFLPQFSVSGQYSPGLPGQDLVMKVALIGPGSELYFWWGHIALVVEDRRAGTSRFFDWGVFSFDTENFFKNFAFGNLIYSCMVSPTYRNFEVYKRTNRDIILYTLNLPPERKLAVLELAEINMLPENRDYLYHHFIDNCATRIRDIIDYAVGGQFWAKYGEMPSRFTLRQHVRRHTWFNPFVDWILNFWMGQGIDRPITVWDDMFLPSEVTKRILEFQFVWPDGEKRPLVSDVEIVFQSTGRPAVLDVPRLQWPRTLLASLLFSGALVVLFLRFGQRKCFAVFNGLFQSFLGLFFGIAGSLLFFMMFFTNHDYTFYNSNIIFVNPLFFLLVPFGFIFAFSKNESKRLKAALTMKFFWVYVFFGSFLTILIKLFPAFYQQNQNTQSLVMPVALAMIFMMWSSRKNNG